MHYDGKRDKERRKMVERGEYRDLRPLDFYGFSKSGLTYAAKVPEDFTVETIEGVMDGHAGDYLAIGAQGEMYPIAADIFEATYKRARDFAPEEVTLSDARRADRITTTADLGMPAPSEG